MVRNSWEIAVDVFVFSVVNVILFGFIANYLAKDSNSLNAQSLLIAVIFWEIIRITQYSISVSSMWNVWSHNLSNMLIAPIHLVEYVTAHLIAAVSKSIAIFTISLIIARYLFGLNVLSLGFIPILFSYLNMVMFATAIGLVLVGAVFQYGTRIQALTWGVIYIIQPLCAVYFPVTILPAALQSLAYIFPVTYFFEWLRALHSGYAYDSAKIVLALGLNVVYTLFACYIFARQVTAAKRSGQIVRNDL